MALFITGLSEPIVCPFMGWNWDGSYDGLRTIVHTNCFKAGKLIPFKAHLMSGNTLIGSTSISHKDAIDGANFFVFNDNKQLVASAVKLSGLFKQLELSC